MCMLNRVWLFVTPWIVAHQALLLCDFPDENIEMDCQFLLHFFLVPFLESYNIKVREMTSYGTFFPHDSFSYIMKLKIDFIQRKYLGFEV